MPCPILRISRLFVYWLVSRRHRFRGKEYERWLQLFFPFRANVSAVGNDTARFLIVLSQKHTIAAAMGCQSALGCTLP